MGPWSARSIGLHDLRVGSDVAVFRQTPLVGFHPFLPKVGVGRAGSYSTTSSSGLRS